MAGRMCLFGGERDDPPYGTCDDDDDDDARWSIVDLPYHYPTMIILAPHALSHHLLGDDTRNVDNGASSNDSCGEFMTSCNEEAESNIEIKSHRRREEEGEVAAAVHHDHQIRQDIMMQQWQNARLKISMSLGSIGAPPLTSSSSSSIDEADNMLADNHDITPSTTTTTTTPNQAIIDETQSKSSPFNIYLDHIIEMAEAHTDLLQSVSRILEKLCDASSIQLGIGPTTTTTTIAGNNALIGNRRLVARAENAWIARQSHLRQHQYKQKQTHLKLNNVEAPCCKYMEAPPTLTLQKLRNILHRAIVDQANSLLGLLEQYPPETYTQQYQHESTAEWNIYVHDLQHSTQLPSTIILTLSQLSHWRNRNGELLSWVLSNHFLAEQTQQLHACLVFPNTLVRSDDNDDDCQGLLSSRKAPLLKSMQFARERIVYLHSACPLSRPSTQEIIRIDNIDDDHDGEESSRTNVVIESELHPVNDEQDAEKKQRQRRIQRQAEHIIGTLQANLEAARITLWAFGQSYSESTTRDTIAAITATATAAYDDYYDDDQTDIDTQDMEDDEATLIWWSQFKDMMERSYAIMSEFDEHIQSPTDSRQGAEEGKEANNVGTSESSKVDGCVATEWSDHVDDATGIDDESYLPHNGCLDVPSKSPHAGKTLVFSGSGIKTPSQPLHTRRLKSMSSSSASSSKQGMISQTPPSALNVVDQVVLLQDLERRIKIMGLCSDEFEVTRMNEELDSKVGNIESAIDGEDRSRHVNRIATASNQTSTTTRNQTFTLSGSLLAELKSTIHCTITTCEEDDQSLSLA